MRFRAFIVAALAVAFCMPVLAHEPTMDVEAAIEAVVREVRDNVDVRTVEIAKCLWKWKWMLSAKWRSTRVGG